MKKKLIITLVIVVAIILVVRQCLFSTSGEYYRTYSPDNQYSVYASKYYYERFLSRMPGGSGDASGKVFLYDEVEQKIINSAPIAIMWTVGDIEWEENKAYFVGENYPNISDAWALPRPIKMPYTKMEENDTIRIGREYSSFDKLHATTIQKPISSCWKPVNYETYDENGHVNFEWQIQYAKSGTCDFTSYIIHYRTYENQQLIAERFEHSACDGCDVYPCGTETKWDSLGKVTLKKVYEDCNINFLPKTNQ